MLFRNSVHVYNVYIVEHIQLIIYIYKCTVYNYDMLGNIRSTRYKIGQKKVIKKVITCRFVALSENFNQLKFNGANITIK